MMNLMPSPAALPVLQATEHRLVLGLLPFIHSRTDLQKKYTFGTNGEMN